MESINDVSEICLQLVNLSYSDQLDFKLNLIKQYIPNLLTNQVIASPLIDNYRNKLRFDIGLNNHDLITIGYSLPKKKNTHRYVYSSISMKHLHPKMIQIVSKIELFLRTHEQSWYSIKHGETLLPSMTIRTSFHTEDVMVIFKFKGPQNETVINYFSSDIFYEIIESTEINIVIEFTDCRKIVKGHNYIHEKLDDYVFKITDESFFQVNTLATEVLYNKVLELTIKYIKPTGQDILFDLCCGTGTIGIYLSKIFTKVFGIDIKQSSIIDANHNKFLNNIPNIEFICNPIENVLEKLISECLEKNPDSTFFAIVDPPRTGMHGGVQNTINNCPNLEYLIYVSCNVVTFKRDMEILGKQFQAIETICLDLFPHTPHCELIVVLKKIDLSIY